MNEKNRGLLFGGIIIVVGIIALLINTGVISGFGDLIGGGFLIIMSMFFLGVYSRDRSKWWPLLPAIVLGVLGLGVIFDMFFDFVSDLLGAAFFYAVFAVFVYVYNKNKSNWWPVIPAGACFTLGTVVLVDSLHLLDSDFGGVVFLLGIGLTFLYLWNIRNAANKLAWAIYPAVVLICLSVMVFLDDVLWLDSEFVFPIILILVGLVIVFAGLQKRKT